MSWRVGILIVAHGLALQGCTGTGYMAAEREAQEVRAPAGLPSELPGSPQTVCIKRALADRGANPSRMTIGVSSMHTRALHAQSAVTGHTPQIMLDLPVQDAIVELGFRVPHDVAALTEKPTAGQYLLDGGISSFSPLTKSTTGRDDIDLLIPVAARETVVARGGVTATAILHGVIEGKHYAWSSATATAVFFQVKDTKRLNLAFRTGVSAGTAVETVEVSTVQDASSWLMREVAMKTISKALGLHC